MRLMGQGKDTGPSWPSCLKTGATFAIFQMSGRVLDCSDFLKSLDNIGANSLLVFLSTMGLI
jgi:hypothetical protein